MPPKGIKVAEKTQINLEAEISKAASVLIPTQYLEQARETTDSSRVLLYDLSRSTRWPKGATLEGGLELITDCKLANL